MSIGSTTVALTWYGLQTILTHDVATVIEGDFEWDEDRRCRTSENTVYPSPRQPLFSPTRQPSTLMMDRVPIGWS